MNQLIGKCNRAAAQSHVIIELVRQHFIKQKSGSQYQNKLLISSVIM